MSLQGIPGMTDTFRAFVQQVRLYTRDFPELNRLVAGEESSDRQIAWAVLDALSDFAGTPPFLGYTDVEGMIQMHQQALLTRMTVIALIESVGLLQTRNHINYTNGGITVGVNDKTPLLMKWLQLFKATTEQMKQRVKVSMNINGILNSGGASGIHSELWIVNSTYAMF